jgi:hypothetical protein
MTTDHPYRSPAVMPLILPKDGDVVLYEGKHYKYRMSGMKMTAFKEISPRKYKRTHHVTFYLEEL